jgi:hypothetical protein
MSGIDGGNFATPHSGGSVSGGFFRPFPAGGPVESLRLVASGPGFQWFRDQQFTGVAQQYVSDFVWDYRSEPGREYPTPTRVSSNPDVVTPNEGNLLLWNFVGAGAATLSLSFGDDPGVSVGVLSRVAFEGTVVPGNFSPGSAAAAAVVAIDDRLAGKNATHLPIYTSQNHGAATYVRNSACWAAGIDLTPISPWNSRGANTRAGVLVSPRHILFAAHYPLEVGDTIRFVNASNVVVTRAISAKQELFWPGASGTTDVVVGLLDSAVDSGIGFAKVLHPSSMAQLPIPYAEEGNPYQLANGGNSIWPVPMLVIDQEEKALVADCRWGGQGVKHPTITVENFTMAYPKIGTHRRTFSEEVIGGDSGNPAFFVFGNQLVLATLLWAGSAGGGSFLREMFSDINAAMTTLGGGYQLTAFDFSAYPSFS